MNWVGKDTERVEKKRYTFLLFSEWAKDFTPFFFITFVHHKNIWHL